MGYVGSGELTPEGATRKIFGQTYLSRGWPCDVQSQKHTKKFSLCLGGLLPFNAGSKNNTGRRVEGAGYTKANTKILGANILKNPGSSNIGLYSSSLKNIAE